MSIVPTDAQSRFFILSPAQTSHCNVPYNLTMPDMATSTKKVNHPSSGTEEKIEKCDKVWVYVQLRGSRVENS